MSSNRSNRFSKLSNPHTTRSSGSSLNLDQIFLGSSGSGQEAGAGRGRGSEQDGSPMAVEEAQTVSSSQSLKSSESRPTTIHNDPFPDFSLPSFERRGPKDPRHKSDREVKEAPVHPVDDDVEMLKGFGMTQKPFYRSKWPGVTWHMGAIDKGKKNSDKLEVVVRKTDESQATSKFLAWMRNEESAMDNLEHKYILKYINVGEVDGSQFVVFPKCKKDLWELVRNEIKGPLEERKVLTYMGQIAQALAL